MKNIDLRWSKKEASPLRTAHITKNKKQKKDLMKARDNTSSKIANSTVKEKQILLAKYMEKP